ncbi:MrcB family domain-containing protein [Desulfopila inferna]|uniref:MrcB family domain-containing protein n=1 Tax=Desulfopila inferna TaxID=468528 RepID=UPI0019640FC0|nr:DUF3578 domain-containing protein [Desulfopila inferna]MBM9604111.1 DUF3578 domain-containing protein [Desulfopila inferna]
MSLNATLGLIFEEYFEASQKPLSRNALAEFIRSDFPATIRSIIGKNNRYLLQGSPGQGNWARVPWAAIFDRFITGTAQEGYYIVYLFREDLAGVHLSLNQGVTSIRQEYGADAKHALKVRANDFLARLGKAANGLEQGPINLACSSSSSLGAFYEVGSICSVYYTKNNLPADEVLNRDLKRFVDLYFSLVSNESRLFKQTDAEVDEKELQVEDLRILREHKRIDRNQKLSQRAKKKHGYICKACGFDFQRVYGNIGKEFIEAHHLVPLSELKGQRIALDPEADFTVLCCNCHSMIHKSNFVSDVKAFQENHLKTKVTFD